MVDCVQHLEELENLLREACEVACIEFHEAKFAPADLADRIRELERLIAQTAKDLEPHIGVEAERDKYLETLKWIGSHPIATDPPVLAAYQMRDRARKAVR